MRELKACTEFSFSANNPLQQVWNIGPNLSKSGDMDSSFLGLPRKGKIKQIQLKTTNKTQ